MNVVRILLLLLIALSCQPAFGQGSAGNTARGWAGLRGPVRKVKVESTYLKREEGKVIESERVFQEEWVYDRAGDLVIQKTQIMFGDPAPCRYQYRYDDKGREAERYCSDGKGEKILERYIYVEDRYGNWVKRVASAPDGDTFRQQSMLYRTITYFE